MRTKLIIITLLALAVGGTCPSDVNSDGTVGITDFLQVLGAWGPCPSAVPVAVDEKNGQIFLRAWSDGTVEVGMLHDVLGPLYQGIAPPSDHVGQVVNATFGTAGVPGSIPPCGTTDRGGFKIVRVYADGYVEYTWGNKWSSPNEPLPDYCFSWWPMWIGGNGK